MEYDSDNPQDDTHRTGDPPGPNFDEALWQAVLQAVPGYLCVADTDRRIRLFNRPPAGRDSETLVGADFADVVVPDQRALVVDATRQVLAGGPAVELELRGADSGRWFRMRMAGVRDRGRITGFVAHALDVDDAKVVELERDLFRARLRSAPTADVTGAGSQVAQRRLELMADALPVLISYVDAARRYQYNNAAYTRWFGTSQDALRGRALSEVLGATAHEKIRGYVDAVLNGRAVTFETTLPYKDAGLRRVVAHYVPDLTADGEVAGFYALVEDVTAQRNADEELRKREDELRQAQKMEALGRLAGGIAHDFNNLLQSVISGCGVVLHDVTEDSPVAQQVARMKRSAERGASLTRQLLTFSRSSEIRARPLLLDTLLADMEMLLERLLDPGIEMEFELRDCCSVTADAGQIQQVLMNLVINARDAMPEGGTLRVTCGRAEVAPGEAASHRPTVKPGRYAMMSVSDTGTGMDEATRARIFDPFFTTKPPEQGTGLGLSTVYGIVQSLGGFIEVDSAPGEGSRFRLFLPCAELRRPGPIV
jgi:PAS domain S-box-containing protein